MIRLDQKEMTKLELALEEACRSMPHGGDHGLRKQVARKLLDSALKGNTTLGGLIEVARKALADANDRSARAAISPNVAPA
jgi:hypothetical protein